jgi:hypothetical protein
VSIKPLVRIANPKIGLCAPQVDMFLSKAMGCIDQAQDTLSAEYRAEFEPGYSDTRVGGNGVY